MFEKISKDVVLALTRLHLTLDHLYILERISLGEDISDLPGVLFKYLERKGYITESNLLTNTGKELLNLTSSSLLGLSVIDIKKVIKKSRGEGNEKYKEWLLHYPATATFLDRNGKQWVSTRILRQDTIENEVAYIKIINEGKYTHEELIKALEFQKSMVIKDSMRTGENKMIYFQGTTPYLNQKTYEKQIEVMKILKWSPEEDLKKEQNITIDSSKLF